MGPFRRSSLREETQVLGVPAQLMAPFRLPGLRQTVAVTGPLLLMLITVTIILGGWWLLVDQD